jgi:hypothetical protein
MDGIPMNPEPQPKETQPGITSGIDIVESEGVQGGPTWPVESVTAEAQLFLDLRQNTSHC